MWPQLDKLECRLTSAALQPYCQAQIQHQGLGRHTLISADLPRAQLLLLIVSSGAFTHAGLAIDLAEAIVVGTKQGLCKGWACCTATVSITGLVMRRRSRCSVYFSVIG